MTAIEVGREYRLAPGARLANGMRSYLLGDTTRVVAVGPAAHAANVEVRALNGARAGSLARVARKYLEPLPCPTRQALTPTPVWVQPTEAPDPVLKVVEAALMAAYGTAVRKVNPDLQSAFGAALDEVLKVTRP